MRPMSVVAVVGVALALCGAGRMEGGILDQSNTYYYSGVSLSWKTLDPYPVGRAQTFTVGLEGDLDRVDVYVKRNETGLSCPDLVWSIYDTGGASWTVLDSGSIAASAISIVDYQWLDISGLSIPVTPGDVLAIGLVVNHFSYHWAGAYHWGLSDGSRYEGGERYYCGPDTPEYRLHTDQTNDMDFKTYVDVIPEPCSFALMGSATLGFLMCTGRRKR